MNVKRSFNDPSVINEFVHESHASERSAYFSTCEAAHAERDIKMRHLLSEEEDDPRGKQRKAH